MRKLFGLAAALMFVAGVSAPASAAVVPFTGSIGIVIAGLNPLPVPGGGLATVNGSLGTTKPISSLILPPGVFATSLAIPLPNAFPIVALFVSVSNNTAIFSSGQPACGTAHTQVTCSGGATLHGRSGLAGTTFVGLFGTATAPFANLTVPLSVAGGGSTLFTASPLGITLMIQGAGWTTGTAAVVTVNGGTVQAGGQGTNLAGTGNEILLVSPLSVYTNATGGFLPSYVTWRVNLLGTKGVPEPGVLLLLGSGVVGLAVYGRRKMKK